MSQWQNHDYRSFPVNDPHMNNANNSGSNKNNKRDTLLQAYWNQLRSRLLLEEPNFREHTLPLARIKKVMKTDSLLKGLMISYEVPVIFSKGAEAFVEELTIRAWTKAETSSRRTLQKSDVVAALMDSEMYDFLLDIVPRDDDNRGFNSSLSINKNRDYPQGPKSALPILQQK